MPHRPEFKPRQRELLELVGRGRKNKQIAEVLHVKERSVKTYLCTLFRLCGVQNRTELAIYAVRNGFVSEEMDVAHRREFEPVSQ